MSIFDRMRLPDNGWQNALYALTTPPKVIAIKPIVESHPDIPMQKRIEDLEDEISNIAFDYGLSANINISYTAECNSCGKSFEVDIDNVRECDKSMNYCGGSQHCLP